LIKNNISTLRGIVAAGLILAAGNSVTSVQASDSIFSGISEFFTNIQLADAGSSLLAGGHEMSQKASGNTGLYFGVNYANARVGDASLKYRSENEVKWDLQSEIAASAQLGWDFGLVRTDLKAVAMDGGVDQVDGNATTNDRSNIAVVTANIYWDMMRTVYGDTAIVPYVGVGGGAVGFTANARSSVDPTDGSNNSNNGDGHDGVGYAAAAHAGVNFEVHDNVGIVLGYEFIRAFGGHDTVNMHVGEVGLRFIF
jgi:opacity protein-like surface antigen